MGIWCTFLKLCICCCNVYKMCLQFIRSFKSYRLDTIYIFIMYSQIIFYSKLLILKTFRSSTEYIIIYFMNDYYLIINLYI